MSSLNRLFFIVPLLSFAPELQLCHVHFSGVRSEEYSQADRLLAFAVSVFGTQRYFPVLLGVSVRSRKIGVVDLMPYEVKHAGPLICLVERPEELGDISSVTDLLHTGEITFALWQDRTYQSEIARIPWREWKYFKIRSVTPSHRIDPCTAAYLGSDFEGVQQRYFDKPNWIAGRSPIDVKNDVEGGI